MISLKSNKSLISSFLKLNRSIKYSSSSITNKNLFITPIGNDSKVLKKCFTNNNNNNNINNSSLSIIKNNSWNLDLSNRNRYYSISTSFSNIPIFESEQELKGYITTEYQKLDYLNSDTKLLKKDLNDIIYTLKLNSVSLKNDNSEFYGYWLKLLSMEKFKIYSSVKDKESASKINEVYRDMPDCKEVVQWLIHYWSVCEHDSKELAKPMYSLFQISPKEWLDYPREIFESHSHFNENQIKSIINYFKTVQIENIKHLHMMSCIYLKSSAVQDHFIAREFLEKIVERYQLNRNDKDRGLYNSSLRSLFSINTELFNSQNRLLDSFHLYLKDMDILEVKIFLYIAQSFQTSYPNQLKTTMYMLDKVLEKFEGLTNNKDLEAVHLAKLRLQDSDKTSNNSTIEFDEQSLSEAEKRGDFKTVSKMVSERFQQLSQPKSENSKYAYAFSMGLNNVNLRKGTDSIGAMEYFRDMNQQITHMDKSGFVGEQWELANLFQREYKFFEYVLKSNPTKISEISYWVTMLIQPIVAMEDYALIQLNAIISRDDNYKEIVSDLVELENDLYHRNDNLDIIVFKGLCYYHMNDISNAIDNFNHLLVSFKKQRFVAPHFLAETMSNMVEVLYKQKKMSEVEETLDWYFSLDGVDKRSDPTLMGYYISSTYPSSKSERILKEILELGIETTWLDVHFHLGEINRFKMNSQVAVNYYNEGLKKEKDVNKIYQLLLGKCRALISINDGWREALKVIDKALQIKEEPEVYTLIAEFANIYENNPTKAIEYSKKAIEILQKSLKEKPSDQIKLDLNDALHHYGTALHTLDRSKEAYIILKSTSKLLSDSPMIAERPNLYYMIFFTGLNHCKTGFDKAKNGKFSFIENKEIDKSQLYRELERSRRTLNESKESLYWILDIVNSLSTESNIHNELLKDLKDSIQSGILYLNLQKNTNQMDKLIGVDIVIKKQGNGEKPPKGSTVSVHYVGTLTNGKKFDSSRDRKKEFQFNLGGGQVIRGWDEGVAQMSKGEIATLTISPDYGYGARAVGGDLIPANSTLIFEVELISWK
ncbi:FKBP-type peptidylprolyl cis-trans isomerase [Tieghemostelium lacteum]|uniref:peptidylprolyl isomerase n=1 Tax=Tieghemostelium lacteum TaxID=361077 RepID=A0A152A3Z6_TIELA|nr:FKBP-type peptidylprolyl cis-trans isomerase [Tieghemostelium lacteum]|eukprot:KYR00797.1 FKBP-type peptidylprolyl cis-trans isomerase [Tieghemostelium lacteum]